MNIAAYMESLSDAALIHAAKTASVDLEQAAESERDSEWHESCFAAAVLYAQELGRRRLTTASPTPSEL